ncbi:GUN4 domain-containing protein [Pleurocapsales cyanobacterium LEGE 06147]|nr:GUN4 domain-containing protein [Pleurocapsales cyanobacterium LEGE 06147]
MNFSRTATGVLVGIIFAAAGQPSLTMAREQQIAQALAPEQINLRAKQITVRIDGDGTGSGVIVGQSGNSYTVITNWHIVKNPGQYSVQTTDGREHPVEYATVRQLAGLDLAVLQFASNQNYQLAEIGNSNGLIEGQNVYFAGYPGELRQEDNRYYRFFSANLVGILPQATENGYALIYNGEAFPGMSGGPVFDRNGRLIGIHGEANIHARTGATSNYAIAIEKYQQAIASNPEPASGTNEAPSEPTPTATNEQTPPEVSEAPSKPAPTATNPDEPVTEPQPSSTPSEPTPTATNEQTPPEVTVDTGAAPNPNQAETTPQTAADPSVEQTSTPLADNIEQNPSLIESEGNINSSPIGSVPTFTPSNSSVAPSPVESNPVTPRPTVSPPSSTPNPAVSQPSSLISAQTGIDYTPLRNLLAEGKWEEADRQTYDLIEQIIKTAKRRNPHTFIELRTIAEFSCPDVATIDRLWRKHSGGRYGFSPQQQIWQTVNQNGDFSTETWRSFATQVGWKHGDIASSTGYLLYEQLIFNPETAPMGHLPWWFALPEESQNVIKHIFSRCNLNEVKQNNLNQVRQENEVRPVSTPKKESVGANGHSPVRESE